MSITLGIDSHEMTKHEMIKYLSTFSKRAASLTRYCRCSCMYLRYRR